MDELRREQMNDFIGCGEIVGAIMGGAIIWGLARSRYGYALPQGRQAGYRFITVPDWLSAVCGRPAPENELEISLMIGQIGGLLLSILWLPLALLGVQHDTWVLVYGVGWFGILFLFLSLPHLFRLISRFR